MAPGAPASPAGAFFAYTRSGTPPHPLPRPRGAFPLVARQGPWEKWVKGMEKNTPRRGKKGGAGRKSPGGGGKIGRSTDLSPPLSPEGPKDHGREALRRRSPEGREKSPRRVGKAPRRGRGRGSFFYPGDPKRVPQDRDAWVGAGAWARFVWTAGRRSRPRNDPFLWDRSGGGPVRGRGVS